MNASSYDACTCVCVCACAALVPRRGTFTHLNTARPSLDMYCVRRPLCVLLFILLTIRNVPGRRFVQSQNHARFPRRSKCRRYWVHRAQEIQERDRRAVHQELLAGTVSHGTTEVSSPSANRQSRPPARGAVETVSG